MVRSLFRVWKKSWAWSVGATLLSCIFLLLPWTSNAATPPADTFRFEIPATLLPDALTRFSEQSGISVGMPGNLPRVMTRPVAGQYSAQEALLLMLAGTGLEPLRLSPFAYRLQARARVPAQVVSQPVTDIAELAEVVVTGAKREQNLRTVPISIAVIDGAGLALPGMPGGSRAALLQDAGMSSTNLGPGRNRQYIRGVADSPFLGPSQATVSVQFDEARATYDGPDPDLRLFDVAQVEILKGPQGPLYGTGALGGVFRIVPRRVDLEAVQMQASTQYMDIAGGAAAGGADIMLNAPLVQRKVGIRAVAYAITEPGWIDNTDGRSDANDTRVRGGRLALRSVLPGDWIMDLQGVVQISGSSDSQYLTSTARPLRRSNILPEPHDNDFYLGSLTASGRLFGQHALVTASLISHEADGMLDASASAAQWNLAAPLRYFDDRQYQLVNQELRLWSDADARLAWLVGASHLSAHSDIAGTLLPEDGSSRNVVQQAQHVEETALFGEAGLPLAARMRATLGLRLFRSAIESERANPEGESASASGVTQATPSLALDWRSSDDRQFVYLRYAQAYRPGGLNPAGSADEDDDTSRFDADELSNLDLGARLQLVDGALSLQGALFATRWSHIQSDYLLPNGLVGTRNVGNGRNVGMEVAAGWQADNRWRFEAGATLQHARLHDSALLTEEDARLPVVPDLRLRASIVESFALADWQAMLRADVNYSGAARLTFDESLDRKTPGYATFDTRFSLRRAGLELNFHAANLFNSRADTFAFGNPFSVRSSAQHTPLQPRSVTIGVAYAW